MTTYVQRDLAQAVMTALQDMPVVVVTGMRQTGKTTFLQNQSGLESRRFVTLDDFEQLEAAKADPDGLVGSQDPLTIDEAQRCPEILTAIKKAVDRHRKPGQFLLSGSASFALLRGITESLAGRAVYFEMGPFTRREMAGRSEEQPFLVRFFQRPEAPTTPASASISPEDVLKGGMPAVCLGIVRERRLWFKGYEQTYLERDLREMSRVENLMAFRTLLRLASLRSGQILSLSQIGRDAKLTAAMATRYLSLLETAFITYRLSPYLGNRASRLIKSPKLYFGDSGIASYLAGVDRRPSVLSGDPPFGALFETHVAQNLVGILHARWPQATLHYWGVQGRHEVDFIVEVGSRCLALEVKSGSRWQERDLSGLKAFLAATPHCVAAILAHNGRRSVRLGERLWAIPLATVLG